MTDTETLDDEALHLRSIILGGLESLRDRVPDWELEQRATAIARALLGHFVRGTVAKGEIGAQPTKAHDDETTEELAGRVIR